MDRYVILALVTVFLLGWVANDTYSSYGVFALQAGLSDRNVVVLQEELQLTPGDEKKDRKSPHDWISMDQIRVYNNRVIIELKDAEWSLFTNTKSMDPVIDGASNAIEIIPESEEDIHIGDIVAYKSNYADGTITHRVIEIGNDENGWYALLKGDNNENIDPGRVRFEQIQRVVVAVIY